MRAQFQFESGRIRFSPFPAVMRPRLGGRRPPRDPDHQRGCRHIRNVRRGKWSWLRASAIAGLSLAAITIFDPNVNAQQRLPDLSGSYRCEGDQAACEASGRRFTIAQTGAELQIRNDKGEVGTAKLTSGISISAGPIWNMFGLITSGDTIEWSNGTAWRRQNGSLTRSEDVGNSKARLTGRQQGISDFPLPKTGLLVS